MIQESTSLKYEPSPFAGEGHFLSGCEALQPGECNVCSVCGPEEYETAQCGPSEDRACDACAGIEACPASTFRVGCGGGSEGTCDACAAAGAGQYQVSPSTLKAPLQGYLAHKKLPPPTGPP